MASGTELMARIHELEARNSQLAKQGKERDIQNKGSITVLEARIATLEQYVAQLGRIIKFHGLDAPGVKPVAKDSE